MALKTVVILTDYGFINGGAGQVALSSARGLVEAGIRVVLCYGVGPLDASLDPGAPGLQVHDLGLHDLLGDPSRVHAAVAGVWKTGARKAVGQVLSMLDPATTVVHLHSWVQALTSSVVRECERRKFAVVCTLHDYFSACPNGGFYNYQTKAICTLEPMGSHCLREHCDSRSYPQKLWRFGRNWVQSSLGHMPSGIKSYISVSDFSECLLRPYLPRDAHFYSVANPIAVERGPAAECARSRRFVFVGRLTPEKGGLLFAEAAQRSGVEACFVGKGAEEGLIRQSNPQATLSGWKDRSAVADIVAQSRCLVFPSVWYETQGLVIKEAAALGIPALVSDACAGRDSIVDGVTGLLFRSGDTADLQRKLEQLDRDDTLAASLGAEAYRHYWDNPCSLDKHVASLIRCYADVLLKFSAS
jgi:glycosyltransferase involved in cell wall biosynthesis